MNNKKTIMNLALVACLTLATTHASAQSNDSTGWLEGTVVDTKGKPVWVIAYVAAGYNVRAVHSNGSAVEAEPRPDMGGLFSMKGLRPGIYDVWVPATKNAEGKYRAQRILGVVVKPGVRTMLNIVVVEGDQLQEIARPVSTEQALIVAHELDRLIRHAELLQRQLDAVQQQLAGLKKSTP